MYRSFWGSVLVVLCAMFIEGCGAATPDAKPAATAKAKKGKAKKKALAKSEMPKEKTEVAKSDDIAKTSAAPDPAPKLAAAAPEKTAPSDAPPSETLSAVPPADTPSNEPPPTKAATTEAPATETPATDPKAANPPVEPLGIEFTEVASVSVQQDGFRELEFSHDGSILMLAALGPIQRWSVPKLDGYKTYDSTSESANFSPDDKLLAVSGNQGSGIAQILNAKTGKGMKVFKNPKPYLRTTRFSPDGKTLSISEGPSEDEKRGIHFWDVVTRKKKNSVMLEGGGWAKDVVFSPDSKFAAFADQNGKEIRIWDVKEGKEEWRYSTPVPRWGVHRNGALRWRADGKIAGLAMDGTYHLMDVANKKMERTQFASRKVPGWVATLSPDGRIVALVSESDSQRITVLDAWAAKLITTLEGHAQQVECLAFSSDGKYLAGINMAEPVKLKLWKVTSKAGASDSK